ncbi:MAG: hypothetical protein MUO34_00415 [Ignavibacteriaceae bacterium]|nr:hypothetical protein [Ignavibacteriaceae bacterium]
MKNIFAFLIFVILAFCGSILSQNSTEGIRIDLSKEFALADKQFAQLFIPDFFIPDSQGKVTLVFHFHGSSWAIEDVVYKSGVNAVLFNIHLGALSSPYKNYFSDENKFRIILDTILTKINSHKILPNPQIDKLIITSFSAGYAGVREILKNPEYYKLTDALILMDGLHCDSDSALMKLQMTDFVRFAEDARDKKKIMTITHSSISTEGYQSTTQTTDYILGKIGANRISSEVSDEIGTQYSKSETGFFSMKGYLGDSAPDHLKHLYGMHILLKEVFEISK